MGVLVLGFWTEDTGNSLLWAFVSASSFYKGFELSNDWSVTVRLRTPEGKPVCCDLVKRCKLRSTIQGKFGTFVLPGLHCASRNLKLKAYRVLSEPSGLTSLFKPLTYVL